jgi:hypothetical protein
MNDERAVGAARPAMSPDTDEDLAAGYENAVISMKDGIVYVKDGEYSLGFVPEMQDDDVLLEIATRFEFIVQSRNEEVEDERNDNS